MKTGKLIENMVYKILKGENTQQDEVCGYYTFAYKIATHILSTVEGEILKVILKPKVVSQVTYGKKNEPKTDLIVITSLDKYKISLKKDESAYLHTSNSVEDSMILFCNPNYCDFLTTMDLNQLKKSLSGIGKIPNFDNYDLTKGSPEDFVRYKTQKVRKYFKKDEYELFVRKTVEEYKKPSTVYINQLHLRESEVQNMFSEMIHNNELYFRHLLLEMITGKEKFGIDSEASADWVVSVDGMFKIDSPHCDYINKKIKNFKSQKKVGRLQNVPRVGLLVKNIKNMSIDDLVFTFPTADLSIKI